MAIQFSAGVRNARLNAIETTISTSAKLRIRTGTQPADCATGDSGTLLATLSLPSDWLADAATGAKAKTATAWTGAATAGGTAGYFRIYDSGETTCHMQGSITATSGGGDMEIDSTTISSGQTIEITTFTLTDANA